MALERLNMHRKKVKNAVWRLGSVGATRYWCRTPDWIWWRRRQIDRDWCRFDLVKNTSGLVLSIRLVEKARLDLVQTYRGLRVS